MSRRLVSLRGVMGQVSVQAGDRHPSDRCEQPRCVVVLSNPPLSSRHELRRSGGRVMARIRSTRRTAAARTGRPSGSAPVAGLVVPRPSPCSGAFAKQSWSHRRWILLRTSPGHAAPDVMAWRLPSASRRHGWLAPPDLLYARTRSVRWPRISATPPTRTVGLKLACCRMADQSTLGLPMASPCQISTDAQSPARSCRPPCAAR